MFLSGRSFPDSSGNPYLSAKLYVYLTGTTTDQDTYTTAALSVANTNPVVADSVTGIFPDIYLAAKRYKFVLKTSADVTIRTWDPVDASLQMLTASSAPSPTYPFLRYYNTGDGHVYRRNAADDGWIDEGSVDTLLNAASVTEQLTGTSTAKASTPDSVAALWQRGTDIASGSTLSLPSTGGAVFNITGTTTVTAISTAQGGRTIRLKFAGVLTLTHNATSLILPGGNNIATVAGDIFDFTNEAAADASGSNWRCTNFEPSDLRLITGQIATQAQMESASATSVAVTPGILDKHPGVPKGWCKGTVAAVATVSRNISSITDTGTGDWTDNFTTAFSAANFVGNGSCLTSSDFTRTANFSTQATGSCRVTSIDGGNTLAESNVSHVMRTYLGDT